MLVMILGWGLVAAMAVMLLAPRSQAATWLHRMLVEKLADITLASLGKGLLLAVAMMALSVAAPELFILFGSAMDAAMLELLLAVWFASISSRFVAAWRATQRLVIDGAKTIRRLAGQPRNRPPRRRKARPQHRRNDDPEPGWALA